MSKQTEQSKTETLAAVGSSDLLDALEAVLLFHSSSPWDEAKKTQWWNLTQTNEATTRNLCDTVRLALGRLPSCFGDFTGKLPTEIPSDMRLSREQRNAIESLASNDKSSTHSGYWKKLRLHSLRNAALVCTGV